MFSRDKNPDCPVMADSLTHKPREYQHPLWMGGLQACERNSNVIASLIAERTEVHLEDLGLQRMFE